MLDLTPTAPAAHYERPRGGSNVSKGASAGCMRAREPYLSDAARGWLGPARSSGGRDDT